VFDVELIMSFVLDASVGDKATGRHKPRSDSASRDSGFVQSGNESVVKALKVGCLGWCWCPY